MGAFLDRLDGRSPPYPSLSATLDRLGSSRRDSSPTIFSELPPMLGERRRTGNVPLATRRESARLSGIDKVDQWKRQSKMDVGVEEVAAKAEKPKKKHDWLGY